MALHRNFAAGFIAMGWSALVGVAFLPIYIRQLGFEAWGVVGFCLTLQAWMSVVETGVSPVMNRELARFRAGLRSAPEVSNLLRSAELLYLCAALGLALAFAAVAPWLAREWLHSTSLDVTAISSALRWIGTVIGSIWLASLYRNVLLGMQLQVFPYAAGALLATFRALATWLTLTRVSATVEAFVIVQLASATLEALVLRYSVFRRLPLARAGRWSAASLLELHGFAAGLAGVTLLGVVLTQGDKLLLSALLSLEQFGFLVLAVTVAGILPLAAGPVFNVCYPRFSELAARPQDSRALALEYRRWSQVLALIVLPPAVVLACFARDVLAIWTRDAGLAQAVAPLLSLWLLGSALNAVMHVPYAAQLAHGWTRLTLTINALAVVLLIPLTLWLVPRYGPLAAGWIWVAINTTYVVAGVLCMHRRILRGEARTWYLHALLAPACATALVAGSFSVWRHGRPQIGEGAVASLIVCCGAAAVGAALIATPLSRRAGLLYLRTAAQAIRAF